MTDVYSVFSHVLWPMYVPFAELEHHHRNQIEMRGVRDDVPADELGDEGRATMEYGR